LVAEFTVALNVVGRPLTLSAVVVDTNFVPEAVSLTEKV
jgi:hypothetical protein